MSVSFVLKYDNVVKAIAIAIFRISPTLVGLCLAAVNMLSKVAVCLGKYIFFLEKLPLSYKIYYFTSTTCHSRFNKTALPIVCRLYSLCITGFHFA